MRLQGQLGISDPIGDLNQIAEVPQALLVPGGARTGKNAILLAPVPRRMSA
jgi:hypothetical protein